MNRTLRKALQATMKAPWTTKAVLLPVGLLIALSVGLMPEAQARNSSAKTKEAREEKILNNIVVTARKGTFRALPKVGVHPSLAANIEDVTLRNVVSRDLDLSGEFRVISDEAAAGIDATRSHVDIKGWARLGAESVVRVMGRRASKSKVLLKAEAYFTSVGDKPVFTKSVTTSPQQVRAASHRLADALIGALTGTPGAFSSELTFVLQSGKTRRAYIIDSDGHNPRPISGDDQLALSPVFGPDHRLMYAASVRYDAFKIFEHGKAEPLLVEPRGSVYGLAFSADRKEVAVAIARGMGIRLFRGPDLQSLTKASKVPMALHPTFSPTGKLAFSGETKSGQRIFVDNKTVSPPGLNASAPVFCRHPDGVRLIYAVGVGKNTDLVASDDNGRRLIRLTQNQGRNNYPACSPDGRLIAFFSTRKSSKGPGLYIMRIDGRRPKRVSTLVGDSLRWARLPTKTKRTRSRTAVHSPVPKMVRRAPTAKSAPSASVKTKKAPNTKRKR